jgi:predicted ATP-grasp superfamily ATP-dependent carboligase
VSFALSKALLVAFLSVTGVSPPTALRQRGVASPNVLRTRGQRDGTEPEGTPAATSSNVPPAGSEVHLPPVLLTKPSYYGTLAAVRALGSHSVPVTTAGPSLWAISAWSKYTTTHVSCPPTAQTARFIAWLMAFGQKQSEKHVLLPTCDDTAWLYARHRAQLAEHFYLSPADIGTIHALLHKGKLAEHARQAGMDVPRTWHPRSPQDVLDIAEEATFPVLIKPVTQVLFAAGSKGVRVDRPEALAEAYAEYAAFGHGRAIVDYDGSVAHPMVQEFFHGASNGIYNISSYAEGGKLWGARAGRKILQRPRRLGIGVCFEEAPLDQHLVEGLERLIQRVDYSGVLETEFVRSGERNVLIDFNPRFYNQMGFDVARGLPLPLLAYFGALSREQPPELAQEASSSRDPSGKVFSYGSAFKVMITSQRISGALSADEADGWLAWYEAHEGRRVDAVSDPDDLWPARIDLMQMVHRHVRYPGDFLRTIVLNR